MQLWKYISCFVVKWTLFLIILISISTILTPYIKSRWIDKQNDEEMNRVVVKRQKSYNHPLQPHDVTIFFPAVRDCNSSHSALDDFPPDIFSKEQRRAGFILIHIGAITYLFILLATVCEFYFISCLTRMGVRLSLPMDVIGATLMAIGSSAPTLFVSIISVFFSERTGDIGIGTIVGSTVFNTLFIVAACGMSVHSFLPVSIYPLIRDSIAYLISTCGLLVVLYDKRVFWFETIIFLAIYGLYVTIMFKNRQIEERFRKIFKFLDDTQNSDELGNKAESYDVSSRTEIKQHNPMEMCEEISLYHRPEGSYKRFLWYCSFPVVLLFHIMVPNCSEETDSIVNDVMTFCLSVTTLGGLSYILVWMICVLGDTLDIPECVLGMTLLAAGSSIPDVIASVIVVRHGEADMAIANAIGSNVFDTLCLGLPWFIKTSIIQPGYVVEIESNSMMLSGIILLLTIVILLAAFYLNSWKLDRTLGIALLLIYISIICTLVVIDIMSCPCNFNF